LEHLEWEHQNEYITSKRYGWQSKATGKLAGYMKEYNNLLFLKVLDSGHMVPMDVPNVGLEMMQLFTLNNSGGGSAGSGNAFDSFEQAIASQAQYPGQATCPVCPTATAANNNSNEFGADDDCNHEEEENTNTIGDEDGDGASMMSVLFLISGFFGLSVVSCWYGMRLGRQQQQQTNSPTIPSSLRKGGGDGDYSNVGGNGGSNGDVELKTNPFYRDNPTDNGIDDDDQLELAEDNDMDGEYGESRFI
jgi:hypothetical protein